MPIKRADYLKIPNTPERNLLLNLLEFNDSCSLTMFKLLTPAEGQEGD